MSFDLETHQTARVFSNSIKINEDRHHLKSAIFIQEFNSTEQISRPESEESFIDRQVVAMAYGQSESADIKKMEIRALSKFDDVLLFKDIRIRNPTMQILKGNKLKSHYSFSETLGL